MSHVVFNTVITTTVKTVTTTNTSMIIISNIFTLGDAVVLLLVHRTCDLQVMGSSSGWALLRSGLGQATYICMPLSLAKRGVIAFDHHQHDYCILLLFFYLLVDDIMQ